MFIIGFSFGYDYPDPPIPEWSSIALFAFGLAGIPVYLWRRNRKPRPVHD